jgi:broad specificity phosphatase PhoE
MNPRRSKTVMTTILIIRHAEKPDGINQGVTEKGTSDSESLIPRGWQRAGAWVSFFSSGGLFKPDRIFVAAMGKTKIAPGEKVGSRSVRPLETVTPLAAKLGLTPDQKYSKGEEPDLTKAITNLDGLTLICWQHEAIPQIASLIKGSNNLIPDPWDSTRFDVVWRLTRGDQTEPWVFDQVCPCLLAGDSAQAL